MTTIASRDLRNHTAEVLRQVSDGTRVTITVNGRPVAEIGPVRSSRPRFFTRSELAEVIVKHQADAALSHDLEMLAGAFDVIEQAGGPSVIRVRPSIGSHPG